MQPVIQQDIIALLRLPGIEEPVKSLYEHYFEGVLGQVCMNGGNREDGADIFQEAILVLIDHVKTGRFRGDSSIKTFLFAIARNLWLHELRSRRRRTSREDRFIAGEEKMEEPILSFVENDKHSELLKVMEQVGDTCKKILTGFYYNNKGMKELLSEFNYENEQVLRNRKSKCMKKLKELLQANKDLLRRLKSLSLYEY